MTDESNGMPARIVWLDNAKLFPQVKTSSPAKMLAGVIHEALPQWGNQRRGMPADRHLRKIENVTANDYLQLQPLPKRQLKGITLYGGPLIIHFGHFIAESIHRCWAYEVLTDEGIHIDQVLFQQRLRQRFFRPEKRFRDLPDYIREIIAYLGVPEKKICLQYKPVIASKLAVPEQASFFRGVESVQSSYLAYLRRCEHRAKLADSDGRLPKKLYVSRLKYKFRGAFAGEAYLQDCFLKQGYTIFDPESLSVLDQLKHYKAADSIVFAEGGAIHMLELLGEINADVIIINRRPLSERVYGPLLRNRTKSLNFFDNVLMLPSLFLPPSSGKPAHGSALSVLDGRQLNAFLQSLLKFPDNAFSLAEFDAATKEDILAYQAHYSVLNRAFLAQQQASLERFRESSKAWL